MSEEMGELTNECRVINSLNRQPLTVRVEGGQRGCGEGCGTQRGRNCKEEC